MTSRVCTGKHQSKLDISSRFKIYIFSFFMSAGRQKLGERSQIYIYFDSVLNTDGAGVIYYVFFFFLFSSVSTLGIFCCFLFGGGGEAKQPGEEGLIICK